MEPGLPFAPCCMLNIQLEAILLTWINFPDGCVFHVEGKLNNRNVWVPVSENLHENR